MLPYGGSYDYVPGTRPQNVSSSVSGSEAYLQTLASLIRQKGTYNAPTSQQRVSTTHQSIQPFINPSIQRTGYPIDSISDHDVPSYPRLGAYTYGPEHQDQEVPWTRFTDLTPSSQAVCIWKLNTCGLQTDTAQEGSAKYGKGDILGQTNGSEASESQGWGFHPRWKKVVHEFRDKDDPSRRYFVPEDQLKKPLFHVDDRVLRREARGWSRIVYVVTSVRWDTHWDTFKYGLDESLNRGRSTQSWERELRDAP